MCLTFIFLLFVVVPDVLDAICVCKTLDQPYGWPCAFWVDTLISDEGTLAGVWDTDAGDVSMTRPWRTHLSTLVTGKTLETDKVKRLVD